MVIIVFMAEAWSSSKGENIVLNISKLASELGQFVKTGKIKEKNPFSKAFKNLNNVKDEEKEYLSEKWILLFQKTTKNYL